MTEKAKLAKKQKRVLDLLVKGKSPGQVAKTLKISVNGVYGHMRRIEAKGYDVPRGKSTTRAKKPVKSKARTNGSVVVGNIDGGIAKLIAQADERQAKIKAEIGEIEAEHKALTDRRSVLHNESSALEQRRKALASA